MEIPVFLSIIGCLCIKLYRVIKQRDVYYSNYQNCLLALGDLDPSLKEYLESRGK